MVTIPAQAAAVQIAKYDFENGTTQGWGPRGSGVSVRATSDSAHSGTQSLLTTGRTANWNGPTLTPPFEKGVTYQVQAFVRLVTGQPSSTIALTVQRTPSDSTSQTFERVGAATVTDAEWVEISGTYLFTQDSTDMQLYIESSDPTSEYYADDILVTSDSDPTRSGIVTDFESGTNQSWSPRAAATLANTADVAHGGTRSLAISNRQAEWDGPNISVLGKVAQGGKYILDAWVRLGPDVAAGNLGLSIERRLNGTPSYQRVAAPKAIPAGQWVELKGTYTLANDVDFLAVYIESDTGTFPFYLDDFSLTFVEPKPIQTDIPSLKDVLPFTIGTEVHRTSTLAEHGQLIDKHYESVTPGNVLKWDTTEPVEGQFNFAEGDYLVDWAMEHGKQFRGHTLVWHSQVPAWVFQTPSGEAMTPTPENKALLLQRLENHIRAEVGRYKGKIGTWDVANEVIDENQPDGMRRSPWFTITGLDYLRTAFRVAHEVDPAAKLVINDFNTEFPRKRQALFNLVKKLRAEGVPIDAVGHQLHMNIEQAPASNVEDTIKKFAELGVDQQVTELDISIYTDFVSSYTEVPESVNIQQGYRYKELFDVFRRQASHLSSVTLWGLADDETWLSNFPINRLNTPLPFDDELQAKHAFWGIADPSHLPPYVRPLNAPAGTVTVDGVRDQQWDLLPDAIISRVNDVSAGFQARQAGTTGLYVMAQVRDSSVNSADTVTFTVGGKAYAVKRDGSHASGFSAKAKKTSDGYFAEALLPSGTATAVDVKVRDAKGSGTEITWSGALTFIPAIKLTTAKAAGPKAPVIDGTVDPVWSKSPEITTGTFILGTSGATAKVRSLWKGDTLYVLAKVTDPALSEESPNAYEHDSVEIFVDPDNGKTKGYDDDDGQYRISFSGKQTINGTFDAFAIKDNLTSAAKVVTGGYVIEAAIKLPTVKLENCKLLGFDVQVNDATGPTRTAAVTWNDPTSQGYLSTARWGVLQLAD